MATGTQANKGQQRGGGGVSGSSTAPAASDAATATTPANPAAEAGNGAMTTVTGNVALTPMSDMDFAADAGAGLEGADKDSFALPFLALLQGLSPQLRSVQGARPGLIINTVTNELFSSIRFVPVAYQRRFTRWLPRTAGGGFKGNMQVSEVETLIERGAAKVDEANPKLGLMFEGTQLKDTRNHFVLLLDDAGGWAPALISLGSTQIKRSKRLNSLIQSLQITAPDGRRFNPASFSHIYTGSSEEETNAQGTWNSWVFALQGRVADPQLYAAAKEFHSQVSSGAVQVTAPPDDDERGAGFGDEGPGNIPGRDVPF